MWPISVGMRGLEMTTSLGGGRGFWPASDGCDRDEPGASEVWTVKFTTPIVTCEYVDES